MKRPNEQPLIDTKRPIGEEPEQRLTQRLTAELADDPDVVVIATCPVNSAGHVATALQGRIGHRVTEWLVDHLDRTGDTATYESRVARWAQNSTNVHALTAAVAEALIDRHADERGRRGRNEIAASRRSERDPTPSLAP